MNAPWFGVAAFGLLVLSASIAAARHDFIPTWETRVFRFANGMPSWLFPVLWLPMQLGNLVVGTAIGLLIAWWAGKLHVAIGVLAAMVLKLVTERIVRHQMASYLEFRQRPGASEPGAVLRGDVPPKGPSFPSGHVILVAAISCVVAPLFPPAAEWVPFALTFLVMFGRVYVGAHNPLDVTAGLGAGLLLGGIIAVFVD
jgi:undecaprenyl-diphosphatase